MRGGRILGLHLIRFLYYYLVKILVIIFNTYYCNEENFLKYTKAFNKKFQLKSFKIRNKITINQNYIEIKIKNLNTAKSKMSEVDLISVAKYLAQILKIQIKTSPGQPDLIIQALRFLLPDAEQLWNDVEAMSEQQEQWNQIIGFLENQILDGDDGFGFQKLDTEEIIQVYKVVIQLVQQALGEDEQEQQREQHIRSQQRQNYTNEDQQHDNKQQLILQSSKNAPKSQIKNQNLQYLEEVKRQQKQKKVQQILQKQQKQKIDKNLIKKQAIMIKDHNNKKSDKKKQMKNKKSTNNIIQYKKRQKQSNFDGKVRPKSSFIERKSQRKQKDTQLNEKKNQNKISKTNSVLKKGADPEIKHKNSHSNKQQQGVKTKQKINKLHSNMINNFQQELIKSVNEKLKMKPKKSQQIKTNPMFRDADTTEMMKKAKRQFDYQVKDHKNYIKNRDIKNRVSKHSHQSMKGSKTQFSKQTEQRHKFLKQLTKKKKRFQEDIVNEQLKYYYQLRDKKVSYIKHMHKLMQKLQRERHLQLHRKQKQVQKQQKQKMVQKIQQVDQVFTDNMKHLKQDYKKHRQQKLIKTSNEIKIMKQMQKKLNKNKQNQLDVMKTLWEQERMKLNLIEKDQEEMKYKLEEIYRKNIVK